MLKDVNESIGHTNRSLSTEEKKNKLLPQICNFCRIVEVIWNNQTLDFLKLKYSVLKYKFSLV